MDKITQEEKELSEHRGLDVLTTMERDSLIYVWRALLSTMVILNKEAPHINSPRPKNRPDSGKEDLAENTYSPYDIF